MNAKINFAQPMLARRSAAGFSLVELMVALVAGLLLVAGIGQVYQSTKQTYNMQEQMSRLQENARYAIERMSRDIRMAGSEGCTSLTPDKINNNLNIGGDPYFDFGTRIQGYEAQGTFPAERYALPATTPINSSSLTRWNPSRPSRPPSVVQGNDILMVRGRIDADVPVLLQNLTPDTVTTAAPLTGLSGNNNDFVMVADCSAAYVFEATSTGTDLTHTAGSAPGNVRATWDEIGNPVSIASVASSKGSVPAEVYKVASTLYYLQVSGSDNGPSLFRKSIDSGTDVPGQALVEGVENMQIVYSQQNDDGTIQYSPATLITNWNQVTSVRVALLLRSVDEVRQEIDTMVYDLNGTLIDPVDDRRIRQVFTSTITLRNSRP